MEMLRLLTKLSKTSLLSVRGLWQLARALRRQGANLMAFLDFAASMFPDEVAIDDGRELLHYRELYSQSQSLALYLHLQYGIASASRVALLSHSHSNFVMALYALSRLGADMTLVNTAFSKKQIAQLLAENSIEFLVFDDDLHEKIPAHFIQVISLNELKKVHFTPKQRIKRQRAGILNVPTGGTSGKVKLAGRRPSGFAFLPPFLALLDRLNLHQHKSLYIAVPACHGYGLSCLILTLFLGKKVLLRPAFDSDLFQKGKVDVIALVPTQLNRMRHVEMSGLKVILSGGAPLAASLSREILAQKGPALYNLYGSSELGFAVLAGPEDLEKYPNTIGKAIPGVSVQILNKKGGKQAANETGLLQLKTSWSAGSAKCRFISTGDLAYMNEEGFLFLKGRCDDMIVSGGVNVYPVDLENVLLEHPAISEAAVIGVADDDFGERLVAFAVSDVGEKEIREWLMPRIARFQNPKAIVFLEEMPVLATGKVDREKLRKKSAG
ncbi:MAG: AMP-binding protein [Thiotrichaceae bacterium]